MLEYDFNDIDDDFITCWSKYLLTGDPNVMMKDLQLLAKKGQINAVSYWYSFNDIGDDSEIDDIVKSYSYNSYNELFAKGMYYSKDPEQIQKQNELLQFVDEVERDSRYGSGLSERSVNSREEILNLPFIKMLRQSIETALTLAHRTDDGIIYETANEIYSIYGTKVKFENDRFNKIIKKNNKKIVLKLLKEYAQKSKNKAYDIVNDPPFCFSLAKSIVLFNDTHKYKNEAIKWLKELANREYLFKFKFKENEKQKNCGR